MISGEPTETELLMETAADSASDHVLVAGQVDPQRITVEDETESKVTNEDDDARNDEEDDVIPQFTRPRSLLIETPDHSKRDAILSKCSSKLYDILTILISIADITTDIMVLISYYKDDRMTFYWISLCILLTAQTGYIFLFWVYFDFSEFNCLDRAIECIECCCSWKPLVKIWGVIVYILNFCILLPCGHLVAFLLYFTEDRDSTFVFWLRNEAGIVRENRFRPGANASEKSKLAIEKMNKHGGFILEAFLEALPQSILQLIAMVYFQETSWIAVGSIILSMTSIMTKSLVISQGLEWKSYIWCWLCVCTDFFSIFFIVSWLFLSNEHINGEFLGYFSVIGEVWCWKVIIGVLPFWIFVFLCYFLFVLPLFLWKYAADGGTNCIERLCVVLGTLICVNAGFLFWLTVLSLIGMLLMEIICFSFLAFNLWLWCTIDRWNYTHQHIADVLKVVHNFISGASYRNNDRIIRILAINFAYSSTDTLGRWIIDQKMEKRLHQITYRDIREYANNPKTANLWEDMKSEFESVSWHRLKSNIENMDWTNRQQIFERFVFVLVITVFFRISLPIYLFSRIVTIFYPYFIVGYVSYNELWSEMNLFEVVMLGTYIGLQVLILILGIFVFRTHWWLWHVLPGKTKGAQQWPDDLNPFLTKTYTFYDEVQWAPVVRQIVMKQLGPDIGLIVWDYIEAMSELRF